MVKGRGKAVQVNAPGKSLVLKPGNKWQPKNQTKKVIQPIVKKASPFAEDKPEKVERPKVQKGEDDDPECWELAQLGYCPRFPCKWAPCVDKDVTDDIFKGARVSFKFMKENDLDAEELGLKVRQPKGRGKKGGKGQQKQQKGGKGKKTQKGKGKVIKPIKEKKPLVGPNGEGADDDTCWEVKQTGACPRFPCKWQPCADLPEDDPIFADAKIRKPKGAKGPATKNAFKKQF